MSGRDGQHRHVRIAIPPVEHNRLFTPPPWPTGEVYWKKRVRERMKNKLLVSACLMGFRVRYNGSENSWRRRCPAGSRRGGW